MSKMEQVIQIGEIKGDINYYIEDYAYTFFRKQEDGNRKKYFLYGEKIETKDKTKLYIYGISQKPKMEQTYFKEYYPLGFLKIRGEEKYWVSLNGKENLITGIYVFYAPNQAMQEYLVDYHNETKTEDKKEETVSKRVPSEVLPMKETMVPVRKWKGGKKKKEEQIFYTIGSMVAAFLLLMILTSANGRNKINLFKEVIKETMAGSIGVAGDEFIIEEKQVKQNELNGLEIENNQMDNYEIEDIAEVNKENKITNDNTANSQQTVGTEENSANNIIEDNTINYEVPDTVEENIRKENQKSEENNSTDTQENKDSTGENRENKNEMQESTNKDSTEENSNKKKEIRENSTETSQKQGEEEYEEYIVKNGDTLVGICKKRYNSLSKMEQICQINNIKNADYIAPGQKLYLPR